MRNVYPLILAISIYCTGCVSFAPAPDESLNVTNPKMFKVGYGLTEYYLLTNTFLPSDITKAVEAVYDILDQYENVSMGVAEDTLEDRIEDKLEDKELTDIQKKYVRFFVNAAFNRIKSFLPDPTSIITIDILHDIKKGIDQALEDND